MSEWTNIWWYETITLGEGCPNIKPPTRRPNNEAARIDIASMEVGCHMNDMLLDFRTDSE